MEVCAALQVYLEDSLAERVWVDRADCKALVDNILTAFGTKLTPKNPTLLESLSYSLPGASSGSFPACRQGYQGRWPGVCLKYYKCSS